MPTPTYTPIASTTLTSSSNTVTFSSIAGTWRDLILVAEGILVANISYVSIRFNGSSSGIYNSVNADGNGSSAVAASAANDTAYLPSNNTRWLNSTTRGNLIMQVFDYAQTDKHKSILTRFNNAEVSTSMSAGRFASTSAITSLTIFASDTAQSFASGSTFSLYGVIA